MQHTWSFKIISKALALYLVLGLSVRILAIVGFVRIQDRICPAEYSTAKCFTYLSLWSVEILVVGFV